MKIQTVEKETGWFIEKENGVFCAKNDFFETCFSAKRLKDLRDDLVVYEQEQKMYLRLPNDN